MSTISPKVLPKSQENANESITLSLLIILLTSLGIGIIIWYLFARRPKEVKINLDSPFPKPPQTKLNHSDRKNLNQRMAKMNAGQTYSVIRLQMRMKMIARKMLSGVREKREALRNFILEGEEIIQGNNIVQTREKQLEDFPIESLVHIKYGLRLYEEKIGGSHYIGQWNTNKNRKEGFGVCRLVDGAKYIGQWKDNFMHGLGRLYYANGDWFEGRIFKGNPVEGTFKINKGPLFVGKLRLMKGKLCGEGKGIWGDGKEYEGQWLDNLPHGTGKETSRDNVIKQGTFAHGKLDSLLRK